MEAAECRGESGGAVLGCGIVRHNVVLTITSLLSIILLTFHLTEDIQAGIAPGGILNMIGVLILVVWLYGTLELAGRRSGYIIIFPADPAHNGHPQIPRDADGTPAPPPPTLHLPTAHPAESTRRVMRPRGAIGQAAPLIDRSAPHPFRDRLARHAEGASERAHIPVWLTSTGHHVRSHRERQSCILVDVHRSSGGCRLSVSTTPAWHCYDL